VRTLTTLEVTPTTADLCAQRNTVQLTIVALDQNGEEIPVSAGTATYSSSAPAIAGVSDSGVVTAAAPGTAMITARFTLDSVTRTASMNATIHEAPDAYPDLAGVYDVTALITTSGWGAEGVRETGVFRYEHSRATPRFAGTFEQFLFFYPGYNEPTDDPLSGSISGFFDCTGQVVFELRMEGLESALWHATGTLTSGRITGHFWDPGTNFGSFTADRRQAE
jgi:hypothetical protein